MDDPSSIGIFVSVGSVIVATITFIKFWTKLSDRITVADRKSDDAIQDAAEAKNDVDDLRDDFDRNTRDMHDQIERMGRADGESLAAMRQKMNEVELFMRDNFVRSTDFAAAMTKIEASQLRMDTKLDRIFEQTRPKH